MLTLRPYQREAVDAIGEYFSENAGNPLIVLPTGCGKSLCIAQFLREAIAAWPDTRVVVVTHVAELIQQNFLELMRAWPEAPAGIYSAGLGQRNTRAQILFCGIQSVHSKAYALQRVDLVIIDEAHLLGRKADSLYQKFLRDLLVINPALKVIGLTATPFRHDSGMLHEGEGALFSDIAYEANVKDMIQQGYLAPPITESAAAQIDTASVGTRGGDFIPGQLELAALDPETVEAVCDDIVSRGADRVGWIVFGCGIDHCKRLRDGLRQRGIVAEAIFGDTPKAERTRLIDAYKRRAIRALVSMAVLTTGFNAPHTDFVAIVRPTKSMGLYVQIVGRGMRLSPGKADCLVADYGGNIARHGPIDQLRIKQPGSGGGEMPSKECPKCEHRNLIAARFCVVCGEPFDFVGSVVSTEAAALNIVSKPLEWLDVDGVFYKAHAKPGKPTSLMVSYQCGLLYHREWVCLEHTGYPRQKAVSWWVRRAPGTQVPNTVAQALELSRALLKPKQIAVKQAGKFFEIVGTSF